MGLGNDLLIDLDDALSRLDAIAGIAQVVDSLKEDNPFDALLLEEVAGIALHAGRAKAATQHAVAADTHVEHANLTGLLVVQQTTRKHVGPAVLLVSGRAASVGNRVAQDDHRSSFLGRIYLECQDVIPMVRADGIGEVLRVAGLQIGCGARTGMAAHRLGGLAVVDSDGHVFARAHLEVHGVRRNLLAWRHRDRGVATKGNLDGGLRVDIAAAASCLSNRELHRFDLGGLFAKFVGQLQTHALAADRNLENLA